MVVLGLARGAAKTSVVGLAKDDVCLGMETGSGDEKTTPCDMCAQTYCDIDKD